MKCNSNNKDLNLLEQHLILKILIKPYKIIKANKTSHY